MSDLPIKYIDYKIDNDGRIRSLSSERIRETEHNVHRLRVYSDFETDDTTGFRVNIALTRADGLTIGPLPMTLAQDDDGKWHRFFDIKEQLTEIVGPLMFGISYNLWELDDEGNLRLKKKYPIFTAHTYIYDANQKVFDPNWDIYQRLEQVEIKVEKKTIDFEIKKGEMLDLPLIPGPQTLEAGLSNISTIQGFNLTSQNIEKENTIIIGGVETKVIDLTKKYDEFGNEVIDLTKERSD